LRYPLSYRDLEEMFAERGFEVDHSTINRWVLSYAPMIEKRLRQFRRPHCGSVRPSRPESDEVERPFSNGIKCQRGRVETPQRRRTAP